VSKLTVLLDAIQDYADQQGLLFDAAHRDQIDAAVRTLLDRLDTRGDLAPQLPRRCVAWRSRITADGAAQSAITRAAIQPYKDNA
jgi:hypothetical protein